MRRLLQDMDFPNSRSIHAGVRLGQVHLKVADLQRANGEIAMFTRPLDLQDLISAKR